MSCYLIHFARPFGPEGAPPGSLAQHYIGTDELPGLDPAAVEARCTKHRNGTGAVLMRHVSAAGIEWEVVRTWPGGRRRERQLKTQGSARRLCPACGVRPGKGWTVRSVK